MSSHMLPGPLVLIRTVIRSTHSHRSNVSTAFIIAVCSLLLSTCKEELPQYASPGIVFSASLTPTYSVTSAENKLHLFITVKNIYEETLDGVASIKGQVQLISREDSSIVKTFTVRSDNITVDNLHLAGNGGVALDPGGTVNFDVAWDMSQRPLVDDSGNDLIAGLLHFKSDPDCPKLRQISDPHIFLIQCWVQIFDRTGPAVAKDVVFRCCLISNYVSQSDCPILAAPCNEIISGGK